MSEANAPSNRQQPNLGESHLPVQPESHANPFIHAMNDLEREENLAAEPVGHSGDRGSVPPDDDVLWDDVLLEQAPNPVSEPFSDRLAAPRAASPVSEVSSPSTASASDSVTLNPGAEDWVASSESTNLSDLISLIQELNQCNTILLDRVSQLEEALERSQNALKNEVQRSQDHPAFTEFSPNGLVAVQELSAAQEQIMDLYKQLEFVHQTSQRQQILVETLTGQLESSQERVAHLEREAALVQRRYNEQSQVLTQYENSCRDLQARLHRQQRYTLQFKAALEKSLEVSSPPFESVAAAVAAVSTTENFFLPKAQRIQPWAVPEEESTHLPWMKLSSGGLEEVNPVSDGDAGDEAGEMSDGRESLEALPAFRAEAAPPRPQPVKPRAAVVQLPGFGNPIPRSTAQPTAITGATYAASQSAVNPTVPAEIPDEHLKQKLDAVVQPLADMLAQAMFSETQELSAEAAQLTHAQSNRSHAAMPEPIDAVADTQDEFASESAQVTQSSDEALLNSVMAEAEDALWQDLARLIDVSTEDIVKASLSGDVSAFESIDFEAAQAEIPPRSVETPEAPLEDLIQSSPERPDTPPVQAPSPRVSRSASAFAPKQSSRSQSPQSSEPPGQSDVAASHVAASQQAPQPQAAPAPSIGSNPSWPSPVVYPLRPAAKKRRSLAAVDLPSFLQQEPGPLPT